ncbi:MULTISPECIES: hypothetical protein [unclassified Marinitoga]|uniref:hypothetical protein n=1 Tax=unclassified Marinitoga TaxID=2640159 RepID=UPI000640D369|nr:MULTISPECIES: hypothetical protein [unclassified Marinitoga]KLO22937.1 hypothetical protein X274_07335 [Marinitoga sp. 1155]NUU99450.1 hypothetical protein [Marinitoga sp. 1154]
MSDIMLKIKNSKIEFPDIELLSGEKIGIYTERITNTINNLIKIIIKPKKYTDEYILEGMNAEELSYFSRRIFHIISLELWKEKDILQLLKNKQDSRKITIISVDKKDLKIDTISEISRYIENKLSDENILIITNSKDLLEAICDKVIDENGNPIDFEDGIYIKRLDNLETFNSIEEIDGKYIPIIFKKRILNVRE